MMGTGILMSLGLVLKVFAFACFLLIQESDGETTLGLIPSVDVFIGLSPTPESQPTNDAGLQPPLNIIPPLASAPPFPLTSPPSPGNSFPSLPPLSQPELSPFPSLQPPPEPVTPPSSSAPPSEGSQHPSPSLQPPPEPVTPPSSSPPPSEGSHHPSPSFQPPPEPITPPSSSPPPSEGSHHPSPNLQPPPEPVTPPLSSAPPSEGSHHPSVPKSEPPNSHDAPSVAPVSNSPAPRRMPVSSPPEYPDLPKEPPSSPPESSKNHALSPALPQISPSTKPVSAEPPSSTPPEQHASHMLAPPPSISSKTTSAPVSAPPPRHDSPVDQTPTQAPSTSNRPRPVHPMNAPPPRSLSNKSKHESRSPAPLPHEIPPPSGSFSHASPINYPVSSCVDNCPDAPAPSPASTSNLSPFVSPKKFPSVPRPRPPLPPPLQSLPPPPPQKDCGPLTCTEPLTYGPSESPCICVYPIQVGLRLGVALYTFFPSVSELASEIAAGVFMRASQVRIMGANAASDNPEKTSVLIYLLPVKTKFNDTTAYFTFERFWHKQVVISSSLFGDYDVLYVKYPGLPPSPPLPPSIIATKPYSGPDNNARRMQPLGIDVSGKHHKHGPNRSILAIIILSSLLAIVVVSALVWVFVSRYRLSKENMDTSPPSTVRSLAKTSVISVTRNGPSSPPVSMSSSLAAYTGSTRTFSLNDMLRATDCFNEARILGEGGFGCVYSGTLEDGTKVAMKILKRNDQQGAREFLAEVEMLGRLHHRNLVKLIGICVEDRTRCLVYELMPNGSLESHLHGVDKKTSPLDWSARLKIALGAARALAYLHEDSSPPVIHRDFKASNILLGDDFTPKVSDFGLARNALNERNKHISTHVMGTFGYVAPEYAMTGHLLVKSDVYSYGVVLLELLTGKKPVDMSQPPGLENLVSWARPMLTNHETLRSIIDQSLGPDFPFDSIAKVAAIASMCVQPEVSHRPFMGEVVQALKLIYEETKGSRRSSCSSREDPSSTVVESRNHYNTNQRIEDLLTQSPVSDYDYRLEVERDLSMSELLSSSARFGMQDSESLRRHSSSGPIRTSKAKHLWKSMRRITGTSLSDHGIMSRLWPGSH